MRYWKTVLVFGLVVVVSGVWGQAVTPAQDSLLQYLAKNQADLKSVVENYQSVSFNWKTLLATFGGAVLLVWLTWKYWAKEKLQCYLQKKAQAVVDSLTNLKTTGILVLSSQAGKDQGNDKFLRKFFKEKGFENVKLHHIDNVKTDVPGDFDYGVVFANNEDDKLNQSIANEYLTDESVLFYYSLDTRWEKPKGISATEEKLLKGRINFANSRAQIYGNLMSSLEYLQCAVSRYGNA